jgi:drug/metabolite transporter (DMT)-like permease
MNAISLTVLAIEVSSVVVGQVLLKHAMDRSKRAGFANGTVLMLFAGGVGGMTVSFFLTLALLQHFDLSYFFPFQASSTILVIAAAAFFLRERLSLKIVVGALLISAGIVLVSAS